jgi:hypothetical protein
MLRWFQCCVLFKQLSRFKFTKTEPRLLQR